MKRNKDDSLSDNQSDDSFEKDFKPKKANQNKKVKKIESSEAEDTLKSSNDSEKKLRDRYNPKLNKKKINFKLTCFFFFNFRKNKEDQYEAQLKIALAESLKYQSTSSLSDANKNEVITISSISDNINPTTSTKSADEKVKEKPKEDSKSGVASPVVSENPSEKNDSAKKPKLSKQTPKKESKKSKKLDSESEENASLGEESEEYGSDEDDFKPKKSKKKTPPKKKASPAEKKTKEKKSPVNSKKKQSEKENAPEESKPVSNIAAKEIKEIKETTNQIINTPKPDPPVAKLVSQPVLTTPKPAATAPVSEKSVTSFPKKTENTASKTATNPSISSLNKPSTNSSPLGRIEIKTTSPYVRVGLSRNSKVKPLPPNVKPI